MFWIDNLVDYLAFLAFTATTVLAAAAGEYPTAVLNASVLAWVFIAHVRLRQLEKAKLDAKD